MATNMFFDLNLFPRWEILTFGSLLARDSQTIFSVRYLSISAKRKGCHFGTCKNDVRKIRRLRCPHDTLVKNSQSKFLSFGGINDWVLF